jgi:hypothetical protein
MTPAGLDLREQEKKRRDLWTAEALLPSAELQRVEWIDIDRLA